MVDAITAVEAVIYTGAGGLKLAADRVGPAGGAPVVMSHGGGQTRHAWKATARMLAERGYLAISLDLRGHGDSAWSETSDYTLNAFRDDLLAVLATLDRPAILVGASLGGIASMLAAGEGPKDKARALVLVDITPKPAGAGSDRIRAFMTANPEGFETVEQAADAVAKYLPHRPRPKDPSGLMKNLRAREGRLHWHWDPSMFDTAARDRFTHDDRLSDAARGIDVPTLLVRGEQSEIVRPDDVDAFLELMPQAEVIDVPGAGHMVAGDQNTVFGRVVLDYLGRNAAA